MGIIFKRPSPDRTIPYDGLEPLSPAWIAAASPADIAPTPWPSRFSDWNGPLAGLPARVVAGLRARGATDPSESPTALLARVAIERALAVTREEFFEPTPDRAGAARLVQQVCETRSPIDAGVIHTLGAMLAQPASDQASHPGRSRVHECFVRSTENFRACCPPREIDATIEEFAGIASGGDAPPPVLAAWTYAQFNIIHPFNNGNGRVARVLASMVMMTRGWPAIFYVAFDNALLYAIFQQLFTQGREARAAAFTRAFGEIHARSVASMTGKARV